MLIPSASLFDKINGKLLSSANPILQTISSALTSFASAFRKAENIAATQFGSPKADAKSVGGMDPQYVISRIAMREPNEDVRCHMELLHTQIKDKFGHMPDTALDWLLGGTRKTSRGGFRKVSDFRKFLNTPAEQIPSSQLTTGLVSILAGMAYRNLRATWTELPHEPQKQHTEIARVIDTTMYPFTVDPISTTFTEKKDTIQAVARTNIKAAATEYHSFIMTARRVSNASLSDNDDENKQPRSPSDSILFKKKNKDHHTSWAGAAREQGIYVRAHISGSAPRICAAIEGLLRDSDGIPLLSENETRDLYSNLLIPHFFRSDYHSIAETQAGIDYYIDEYKYEKGKTQFAPVLRSAKENFERGIDGMIRSIRNTVRTGEGASPQQAAANLFKRNTYSPSLENPSTQFYKRSQLFKKYFKLHHTPVDIINAKPKQYRQTPAIWPEFNGKVGIFIPSGNSYNSKKLSSYSKNIITASNLVEARYIILDYLSK